MSDILTKNVKSYPSIYSKNGGNINSEENMRWMTKRLTTKPYVINGLGLDGQNGINIGNGLESTDGYTIKISNTETISFDKEQNNYIRNLTDYYDQQSIVSKYTSDLSADYTTFLFDVYNMDNSEINLPEITANYENALRNNLVIGYVYITYSDTDITSKFTIINDVLKYKSTNVKKLPIQSFSIDDMKDYSDVYYTTASGSYTIYYPIKLRRKEVKVDGKITTKIVMYVKDVFGNTIYYTDITKGNHLYPNTGSIWIDMNATLNLNKTVDSTYPLPFNISTTNQPTLSNRLYDYYSLMYVNDSIPTRKTSALPDDFDYNYATFGTDILTAFTYNNSAVFIKKELSQLVNNSNTITIYNNLDYYIIGSLWNGVSSFSASDMGRSIDFYTTLPVAFVSSNGALCPNGLIVDDQKYDNDLFIEGYLHWFKRLYLTVVKQNTAITDYDYNAVDVYEIINDSTQFRVGASIVTMADVYVQFILPAVCVWMNVCYSSCLGHSGFGTESTNKLVNNASTITGFTSAVYDYTVKVKGYNLPSDSTNPETLDEERTIYIYNEPNNDSVQKLGSYCINTDTETVGNCVNTFFIKRKELPLGTATYLNYLQYMLNDPINWIRQCAVEDGDIDALYNCVRSTSNIPFYTYTVDENTLTPTYITIDTGVNNICVDEWLMPMRSGHSVNHSTHYDIDINTKFYPYGGKLTKSLIHGMCIEYADYAWMISFPVVSDVHKDYLNYLLGNNVDTGKYAGITFETRHEDDMADNDVFIGNMELCALPTTSGHSYMTSDDLDIKTAQFAMDTFSNEVKSKREAFLHISKIYGDNYESLADYVNNSIIDNIYEVELFMTQLEYEEIVSLGIVDYNKIYNIWESDYIDFGQCGDNAYYYLYEDGSLLITGIGTTWNYEYANSPFYKIIHANDGWADIKKVVIANGITSIGNYLFADCGTIESVVMPKTIERIGVCAFLISEWYEIKATIPSEGYRQLPLNQLKINVGMDGCTRGLNIIPSSVKNIEFAAFWGSTITNIVLNCPELDFSDAETETPGVLNDAHSYIFRNCRSLETVRIMVNGAVSDNIILPNYMFGGCVRLQSIMIGVNSDTQSITYGKHLFNYCASLESIVVLGSYDDYSQLTKNYGVNWDSKTAFIPEAITDNFKTIMFTKSGSATKLSYVNGSWVVVQ